jgi:hypothetical protein
MNDKRLTNAYHLLSLWYASTNLKPITAVADDLRYMDAKYLAGQLHLKPRMIYKLTEQLLDNHEITAVSQSYNGSGKGNKAYSRLYQIDKEVIENYILLIQMQYHTAAHQVALLPHSLNSCGENSENRAKHNAEKSCLSYANNPVFRDSWKGKSVWSESTCETTPGWSCKCPCSHCKS